MESLILIICRISLTMDGNIHTFWGLGCRHLREEHCSTSHASDHTQDSIPGKGENLFWVGEAGPIIIRAAANITYGGTGAVGPHAGEHCQGTDQTEMWGSRFTRAAKFIVNYINALSPYLFITTWVKIRVNVYFFLL